jgi:hypothetical protein
LFQTLFAQTLLLPYTDQRTDSNQPKPLSIELHVPTKQTAPVKGKTKRKRKQPSTKKNTTILCCHLTAQLCAQEEKNGSCLPCNEHKETQLVILICGFVLVYLNLYVCM